MSERPLEWNPWLRPWQDAAPATRGGTGEIETYDPPRNIPWQTRAAAPSEYEAALADALMATLGAGARDLAGLVRGLAERRVRAPSGEAWSEETLAAELKRLGA